MDPSWTDNELSDVLEVNRDQFSNNLKSRDVIEEMYLKDVLTQQERQRLNRIYENEGENARTEMFLATIGQKDPASKRQFLESVFKLQKDLYKVVERTRDARRKEYRSGTCGKHGRTFEHYCKDCKELACQDCFAQSHLQHKTASLTSIDKQFEKVLKEPLESDGHMENSVKECICKVFADCRQIIERESQALAAQLAEMKDRVLSDLMSREKAQLSKITDATTTFEEMREKKASLMTVSRAKENESMKERVKYQSEICDEIAKVKQKWKEQLQLKVSVPRVTPGNVQLLQLQSVEECLECVLHRHMLPAGTVPDTQEATVVLQSNSKHMSAYELGHQLSVSGPPLMPTSKVPNRNEDSPVMPIRITPNLSMESDYGIRHKDDYLQSIDSETMVDSEDSLSGETFPKVPLGDFQESRVESVFPASSGDWRTTKPDMGKTKKSGHKGLTKSKDETNIANPKSMVKDRRDHAMVREHPAKKPQQRLAQHTAQAYQDIGTKPKQATSGQYVEDDKHGRYYGGSYLKDTATMVSTSIKDIPLNGDCRRLSLIDNHVWAPISNKGKIEVYTSAGRQVNKPGISIDNPVALCKVGGWLYVACGDRGIHCLRYEGVQVDVSSQKQLQPGNFSDVCGLHQRLYAWEYQAKEIYCFDVSSCGDGTCEVLKQIPVKVTCKKKSTSTCVYDKLLVHQKRDDSLMFYLSEWAGHNILQLAENGDVLMIFGGEPGPQALKNPFICGIDKDAQLLVADQKNNVFKVTFPDSGKDNQWINLEQPKFLSFTYDLVLLQSGEGWFLGYDRTSVMKQYRVSTERK